MISKTVPNHMTDRIKMLFTKELYTIVKKLYIPQIWPNRITL